MRYLILLALVPSIAGAWTPYAEVAIGPALMKGETTIERVGYRSYRWEDERSLHLNGHVAIGITHGVGYVEAFHDSAIGQDDAGTDGVRIGVRWEWD